MTRAPRRFTARVLTRGTLVILAAACACRPPATELHIVALRDPSLPRRYFSRFDESYFRFDALGNLDLVLRGVNESPSETGEVITEVVHVHAFWEPIPGRTFADASMTNAKVAYSITTEVVAMQYEGGGFLSFKLDEKKHRIQGRLESAQLVPTHRRGDAHDLFGPARVTGTFTATDDARHVVRILNELKNVIGVEAEEATAGR